MSPLDEPKGYSCELLTSLTIFDCPYIPGMDYGPWLPHNSQQARTPVSEKASDTRFVNEFHDNDGESTTGPAT